MEVLLLINFDTRLRRVIKCTSGSLHPCKGIGGKWFLYIQCAKYCCLLNNEDLTLRAWVVAPDHRKKLTEIKYSSCQKEDKPKVKCLHSCNQIERNVVNSHAQDTTALHLIVCLSGIYPLLFMNVYWSEYSLRYHSKEKVVLVCKQ
jgi:hypothetical protein